MIYHVKNKLLQDPVREKFVFLQVKVKHKLAYEHLTDKTDFHGVVYKYGKVTIPDESKLDSENKLNLKFEYDILENNGYQEKSLEMNFSNLIGDILYHIIVYKHQEDSTSEPDQ